MSSSSISICQIDLPKARSLVIRLLQRNLPEAATEGRFEWTYLENPYGEALVWLAETSDGEAIGTSAAFPRQFRVQGKTVDALVLSDFVVDSRFRVLGPAIALLRATLAPVDLGTFEFALDYPSESMLAVYKRLGGAELTQQSRYVRLLRVTGAARRRWGPGIKSRVIGALGDAVMAASDRFRRVPTGLTVQVFEGAFDDEFTKVGELLEDRRPVFGLRSPPYLNWRYRSGIRFDYLTVTVRSEQELFAYAILQRGAPESVSIVEFVCPEDSVIERSLLHGLIDAARHFNADSLQASCMQGSAWCQTLEKLGFSAREHSTGPVIYARKNSKWAEVLTDADQWWMTDGDRDG